MAGDVPSPEQSRAGGEQEKDGGQKVDCGQFFKVCTGRSFSLDYDGMFEMLPFQDRSVSEIETSFSEHFVPMGNQSEESSDEFPSSEFHFLAKLDTPQAAHITQLSKFEDYPSRPTSFCSTIITSAPSLNHNIINETTTQQDDPANISDNNTGSETPVNTDILPSHLDTGEGEETNQ